MIYTSFQFKIAYMMQKDDDFVRKMQSAFQKQTLNEKNNFNLAMARSSAREYGLGCKFAS